MTVISLCVCNISCSNYNNDETINVPDMKFGTCIPLTFPVINMNVILNDYSIDF